MKKRLPGFTIVELLIVIVVIAILAAITVVAYNGIRNRADDAVIQQDLTNLAKKIQLASADTGVFPAGGAIWSGGVSSVDSTSFPGFTFNPSKKSYSTVANNLFYCTGIETSSGERVFRVAARSKSNAVFRHASNGKLENMGPVGLSWGTVCNGLSDPYTSAYGYYAATDTWWAWTNG